MDYTISIEEASKILGKGAEGLSDMEVQKIISAFQFLAEAWLDTAERETFKGSTINELLLKGV